MATTFLDEKISSFIEDKFPEFVKSDHPVFVDFLRLYYEFMEAAKITLTNVQLSDQILLENKLTENFMLNEDGTKFVYEDSTYGVFIKGETVTGQTSGAVGTILAEDNAGSCLYIEQNRHFQVGEVIVGGTSDAAATISKYQGNPVQNIQQLLEYVDIDKTITDFFDRFRNTYLTAVPNTLASGVSKRKLVKSIRDLYRAKGSKKGHEIFFRLMFGETPELFYPTDNLLKISAGDWSTDTVIRVVATANSPNNLVGQTITQTVDTSIDALAATATVEGVLQLQEGETTVYQLILNVNSIVGTYIVGAEITGVDNTNADVAISGTVQAILTGASVTSGASGYTIDDDITVTSTTGNDALVSIVDVGSGEVDQVVIDNPGSGYAIGDYLYFDNTNTEGAGASAIVSNIGGAVGPEAGDIAEYGMAVTDHIIYEPGTESSDAYTGAQIQLETDTFANLDAQGDDGPHDIAYGYYTGITAEKDEIVNIVMNSKGSGYEKIPTVVPTKFRLLWSTYALTSSGTFLAGETVTQAGGITGVVASVTPGVMNIANPSGTFTASQTITGGTSGATMVTSTVTTLGSNATFVAWSTSGIGSIAGVEVSKFGTKYSTAPTVTVPVKLLITRNTALAEPYDVSVANSFAVGDTITGQTSSAIGVATAWDNSRQILTVNVTQGTYTRGEVLRRGSTSNYATIRETSQATLTSTIGTLGTTAGAFNNDKGKISESLMKIQDSYYYQDFSYVVRVGAAIKDWRAEIKKSVHPAGFAMFGEVSLINKVEVPLTVPVSGILTDTPELASLFEAVLTTVVGRRLGTDLSGTAVPQSVPVQYQRTGDIKLTPDQQILLEPTTPPGYTLGEASNPADYLILEDEVWVDGITEGGGYLMLDSYDGTQWSETPSVTTITNITTTNLAAGQEIWGPSLPFKTTIVSIDTASSAPLHNNGEITISKVALAATENEWFTVSVPYTTEYSIANTLLGETEIKGTTNHNAGTLKRGSHYGHKTPLNIDIDSITRIGTVATVETNGAHGVEVGELIQITGVNTVGYNGNYETISGQLTLTGNTTSGSKSVTNITTTNINATTLHSITGAGIPANVTRVNSITTGGSNNNGTIELTHAATATATGVTFTVIPISEDQVKITVANGLASPAVLSSSANFLLISPFDNSTRDVTARPHTDVTIYPLYGDWASAQRNRYGLGPRQVNAMKYMWSAPPTEYAGSISDTLENHQTLLESSTPHNDEFLILEPDVLPSVDFTVTVAGGKFVIDGTSQKALGLDGARHYRFDLSDSSVSGHPFRISETSNGTHDGGLEYDDQSPDPIDFQIELESGSYTEYSLLTDTRWNLIAEDGNDLTVQTYSRVTTYGTAGTAGAHLYLFTENIVQDLYYYCSNHSAMGSSLTITSRSGGYIINEAFQLAGTSTVTNILLEDGGYILYETDTDPEEGSIMVSEESTLTYASVTEDVPNRMDGQMAYAYPNITRRESPESGTDNVDAGGAGVYDTTMTYTNIQIGDHESNVHYRISDFADVVIEDVIKCGREFLELSCQTNKHEGDNDYHFTLMEDGSYVQMEAGSAGIPTTSRKIWNVPPPSYIRLTTS